MPHLSPFLRSALVHYGYWTVAIALLLEGAGLPLPGEIVLLLASFLACSQHELQLGWLIVVATLAATAGGNLGYLAGLKGGWPLLDRYSPILRLSTRTIQRGEEFFVRYGSVAIFFARFVFGLRVVAGVLAGVLRMPWKKFAVYNFLGALAWVSVISGVAFGFGSQWGRLARMMKQLDWALVAVCGFIIVVWWLRRRWAGRQE